MIGSMIFIAPIDLHRNINSNAFKVECFCNCEIFNGTNRDFPSIPASFTIFYGTFPSSTFNTLNNALFLTKSLQ